MSMPITIRYPKNPVKLVKNSPQSKEIHTENASDNAATDTENVSENASENADTDTETDTESASTDTEADTESDSESDSDATTDTDADTTIDLDTDTDLETEPIDISDSIKRFYITPKTISCNNFLIFNKNSKTNYNIMKILFQKLETLGDIEKFSHVICVDKNRYIKKYLVDFPNSYFNDASTKVKDPCVHVYDSVPSDVPSDGSINIVLVQSIPKDIDISKYVVVSKNYEPFDDSEMFELVSKHLDISREEYNDFTKNDDLDVNYIIVHDKKVYYS